MGDVHHKRFQVRVVVEQIVEKQAYSSSPVDSGRTDQTITHAERKYEITETEFSSFVADPIKALGTLDG